MRIRWLALVLFGLVAACFAPALRFGLVFDDRWLVADNPVLNPATARSLRTWVDLFSGDLARQGIAGADRPILMAGLLADTILWGGAPFGFHLHNVLLHAAVAVLLFFVLLRAWPDRLGLAWFAAGLFALHPINREAIAVVQYREHLLAAAFLLLGVLALPAATRKRQMLAIVAFTLSGLSSRSGYLAPLAVLILELWRSPESSRQSRTSLAIAAAATLLAGSWREVIAATSVQRTVDLPDFSLLADAGQGARLLAGLWAFLAGVAKVLIPVGFQPAYYDRMFAGFFDVIVAASMLALLLAVLGGIAFLRRRAPELSLGVALALCGWLPFAGFSLPIGPRADHRFYLSALALCPLLAWSAGWLVARAKQIPSLAGRNVSPRLAWSLAILVLAGLAVRSRAELGVYRDDLTLSDDLVRSAKLLPSTWVARAEALLAHNQSGDALYAATVARGFSSGAAAHETMGLVWLQQGNVVSACNELESALTKAGPAAHPELVANLGYCHRRAGRFEDALKTCRRARAASPRLARAWLNEASALASLDRFDEAAGLLHEFIQTHGASTEARHLLARLRATRGN